MASEFSKLTWLRESRTAIRTLTATQRDVLDVIFDRTNGDGQNAHPSQESIAAAVGKSQKQVGRVLAQLRELGLIVRTKRGHRPSGHADVYALGPTDSEGLYRTSRVSVKETTPIPDISSSIPDILESYNGHPGCPPNRSFTSDPGPTDPDMRLRDGEDDPQRESEPDVSLESVSSSEPCIYEPDIFDAGPSPRIATTDAPNPFASAPTDASAQRVTDQPTESEPAMPFPTPQPPDEIAEQIQIWEAEYDQANTAGQVNQRTAETDPWGYPDFMAAGA